MWLGIGEESKIALVTVGAFWPVLLNTIAGVQSTDPKLIEVAQVFGKSKLVILKDIIIPSTIPSLFTGLRLSISTAWSCVVAAEMIAADKGVGYLIMFARQMSKPAELFVGIISIGVIGLAIDILVQLIQKKAVYWTNTAGK
jgi:sulfonate transport system permease protein